MLGNIESGLFQPLEADLAAIAFSQPTHAPMLPMERTTTAQEFMRFVGRYSVGPDRPPMEVALVDGRLAVNAGDGV